MVNEDPLSGHLKPILENCPEQAGPLYTSYRDLALSVEWSDLRCITLPGTEWAVIIGHKRRSDPLKFVLPLPLHTTSLRPSSLKQIFSSIATLKEIQPADEPIIPSVKEIQKKWAASQSLKSSRNDNDEPMNESQNDKEEILVKDTWAESEVNNELDRETLYLAIVTTDSTVVYYKLSKGIRKPSDIPDE